MVSGRYGLEVEQWSDNRTLPISAVRIPLGTQIYMVANAPARYSRYIPMTLRSGCQRYPYEMVRYNVCAFPYAIYVLHPLIFLIDLLKPPL